MAPPASKRNSSVQPGARCVGRPSAVKSGSRVPVERMLPRQLQSALQQEVAGASEVSAPIVSALDRRFNITDRYGLSRRRLRAYLQRFAQHSLSHDETDKTEAEEGGRWPERLRAHRKRQQSVASILDTVFGRLADCSPELWERRAYLMLLGMVYERLGAGEEDLPTEELVALAKVLAENRRVEVRSRERVVGSEDSEPGEKASGELPERFADVVRQVYGTNFQAPDERQPEPLPDEGSPGASPTSIDANGAI